MDEFGTLAAALLILVVFTALSMFLAVAGSVYGLLTMTGARRLTRNRAVSLVIALVCGVLFPYVALLLSSTRVPLMHSYILVAALTLTTLLIALSKLLRLKVRSTRGGESGAQLSTQRREAIAVSLCCAISLILLSVPPTYVIVAPRVEAAENDRKGEDYLMRLPLESIYDIDGKELAAGNDVEISKVDPLYSYPELETTYSVEIANRPVPEGESQYIEVVQYADGFDRRMRECVDNEDVGDPQVSDAGSIFCDPLLVTPQGQEVRIYDYVNPDTEPTIAEHDSFFVGLEGDSYATVYVPNDMSENGLVGDGRKQFDLVSAIDALEAVPKREFRERASGNYIDFD